MATEIIAAHPDASGVARQSRERTKLRWVRFAGAMLVLLVVAFAGVVGTRAWLDRRAEIDHARRAASATRHEVTSTRAALAAATAQLTAARETLATERATLAEREADRDAVETMLHAIEQQLADNRAALTAATADLATRRARLDALNDCVLGVSQALNQIGAHDTNGLARTLSRIEGTCARAGAAL